MANKFFAFLLKYFVFVSGSVGSGRPLADDFLLVTDAGKGQIVQVSLDGSKAFVLNVSNLYF